MTSSPFARLLPLAAILSPLIASPAQAEVRDANELGFVVHSSALVKADERTVWLELIQPGDWWNDAHTWTGKASNMTLTPQAGGCFCETIPPEDSGSRIGLQGSVQHMVVIYAAPDKVLRMRGGLGPLQSEAADGVLTITLLPEKNKGTRITFEYVVGGYMRFEPPKLAGLVDAVLIEQLTGLAKKLDPIELPKIPAPDAPAAEKPVEAKPAEPKPASGKPADGAAAVAKPADANPSGANPSGAKPPVAKPADAKPAEPKPAPPTPAGSKPAEPKPSEARPAGAAPVAAKPSTAAPAEAKPPVAKPADPKPADPKPAAAGPARPAGATPAKPGAIETYQLPPSTAAKPAAPAPQPASTAAPPKGPVADPATPPKDQPAPKISVDEAFGDLATDPTDGPH